MIKFFNMFVSYYPNLQRVQEECEEIAYPFYTFEEAVDSVKKVIDYFDGDPDYCSIYHSSDYDEAIIWIHNSINPAAPQVINLFIEEMRVNYFEV